MPSAIVERHYAIAGEKNTKNMFGVLQEIPKENYDQMVQTIKMLGQPSVERNLGSVVDKTRYYSFEGNNVFLENGLAQTGRATTADNMDSGFEMTRLFANSLKQMGKLETECGLRF